MFLFFVLVFRPGGLPHLSYPLAISSVFRDPASSRSKHCATTTMPHPPCKSLQISLSPSLLREAKASGPKGEEGSHRFRWWALLDHRRRLLSSREETNSRLSFFECPSLFIQNRAPVTFISSRAPSPPGRCLRSGAILLFPSLFGLFPNLALFWLIFQRPSRIGRPEPAAAQRAPLFRSLLPYFHIFE